MKHTLTMTVDDSLYQALSDAAAKKQTTMDQLVIDLLKKQLQTNDSTAHIMEQLMKANLKAQEDLLKVKTMTVKK